MKRNIFIPINCFAKNCSIVGSMLCIWGYFDLAWNSWRCSLFSSATKDSLKFENGELVRHSNCIKFEPKATKKKAYNLPTITQTNKLSATKKHFKTPWESKSLDYLYWYTPISKSDPIT